MFGSLPQDLRRGGLSGIAEDGLAGTLTAVLLIPQALAYAGLAGLPAQVGLYASVLPVVIYALLGSSRTLAIGPAAIAAVMVGAALAPYADGDPARYLGGALVLSALTGACLLGLGLLRLGWLSHFISHPVLSGFTSGAALLILATQLPTLLGIPVPRGLTVPELTQALWQQLPARNPTTAGFGLCTLLLLILARRPLMAALTHIGLSPAQAALLSRLAPLVVVIFAAGLAWLLDAPARWNVPVVGTLPQGLPWPSLAVLSEPGWLILLPSALMIALIGYVESLSVAKALAFRRRERIDPDRELLALGSANLGAALAGAMPVAGGFARSMVNFEAGARSQLAALVTAAWVALAALCFTGTVASLPNAVLAALIMVAVSPLVDLAALRRAWRYDRAEGLAQLGTLLGVLVFGIEAGLLIGAASALSVFLYRTSRPHIAVVGRLDDSPLFRNVQRHSARTYPGLLLIRIDESLYFANAPVVEAALQARILEVPSLHDLVLLMPAVNAVDASGLEMLDGLESALAARGVRLHLAEIKGPVMDRLAPTPLLQRLMPDRVHFSAQAAVERILGAPPTERAT